MVDSDPMRSNSILCLHTRFDKLEMEMVMGGPDTVFVTMLRDPVDVFESQWQFYGLHQHYGMGIGKI